MSRLAGEFVLQAVGLSATEERVYRAVLRQPSIKTTQLSKSLGLSIRPLGNILGHLEELGLLRRASNGNIRYAAVAPDLALAYLVSEKRSQLDRLQLAAAEFAEEYRATQLERHPSDLIEIVVGASQVASRAEALMTSATTEICGFDRPPYVFDRSKEEAMEVPSLAKGVKTRAVYSQSAIEWPGKLEVILDLARAGEEARVTKELPIKMQMADQRVAMVPLTSIEKVHTSMAIVHRSGLLDGLRALFEAYWSNSVPISQWLSKEPASGLTPEQQRLLGLLAAGVKDEAIARSMKVSLRTARRRIHDLTKVLGTSTRFQAGAQAVRRGWL